MHDSLRSLLRHIVDYAGLFPPARLDMQPAVENYAAYLHGDNDWMLGRLIVPVARFAEFESAAANHLPSTDDAEPWRLSAITAEAASAALTADLDCIAAFNDTHEAAANGKAVVDVIELRAADAASIDRALDVLPDSLFPYFEIPAGADPRGMVAALSGSDAGAKIRLGGLAADAFPDPSHVARFIHSCTTADVPFKATAGLHHPLRHRAAKPDVMMHGFLNVFIAAALAWRFEIDADTITQVLEETALEAFTIEAEHIGWQELRLDLAEIEDTRLAFAVSYGSCSFDEPREDLQSLNLM
jgi:hypothetical protein